MDRQIYGYMDRLIARIKGWMMEGKIDREMDSQLYREIWLNCGNLQKVWQYRPCIDHCTMHRRHKLKGIGPGPWYTFTFLLCSFLHFLLYPSFLFTLFLFTLFHLQLFLFNIFLFTVFLFTLFLLTLFLFNIFLFTVFLFTMFFLTLFLFNIFLFTVLLFTLFLLTLLLFDIFLLTVSLFTVFLLTLFLFTELVPKPSITFFTFCFGRALTRMFLFIEFVLEQ